MLVLGHLQEGLWLQYWSGEGGYSRHEDNTEVEPVPGIPEESELPHTKSPSQDLDQGLERVDPRERVPERGTDVASQHSSFIQP